MRLKKHKLLGEKPIMVAMGLEGLPSRQVCAVAYVSNVTTTLSVLLC